jgi:hypothetical protein
MAPKSILASLLLLPLAFSAPSVAALNPSCAPGGNFDMSVWSLQLPTGSKGKPDVITSARLQGCSGYQSQYFFTDTKTGQLVMKVPGSPASSGCVTTSGSKHCRTELREVNPSNGQNVAWDPRAKKNQLTVSLAVITPDDGTHGTAIGQVFASGNSKPVAEMYYSKKGDIVIGVEQTPAGGNEFITALGNVPVGTRFTYVLSYQSNILTVSINGKSTTLSTFSLNAPKSYFKAGNYDQGNIASEVHFFSIDVAH